MGGRKTTSENKTTETTAVDVRTSTNSSLHESTPTPEALSYSVTVSTLPQTQSPQDFFAENLPYVIGVAAGGCILLLVLLVVIVVCIKCRKRATIDPEANQDKYDGIYDKIGKKKKKEKKKVKKQISKNSDQENNNETPAIELGPNDTAPDIITAHDNESIYETLDGKRAARRANMTAEGLQPRTNMNAFSDSGSRRRSADGMDLTYDHLSRYNKQRPGHAHGKIPEKRLTDPEVVIRPKLPPKPRAAHSEGESVQTVLRPDVWTGRTLGPQVPERQRRPSEKRSSSLTELARQSVSGGKRIVCQLTMIGVVENGKPVPVEKRAASNAYFILEPRTSTGGQVTDAKSEGSPTPKFWIRNDFSGHSGGGGGGDVSGRGDATHGTSDYFVLEPLNREDKLAGFADTLYPGTCQLKMDDDLFVDGDDDDRCGPRGAHSAGSLGDCEDKRDIVRPPSFRTTRLQSCPDAGGMSADGLDTAADGTLHHGYRRSFSSPQSSNQRRGRKEDGPCRRKMDAETLQACIQREMQALGFLTDVDHKDGTKAPKHESQGSGAVATSDNSPQNDYFILEPQANASDQNAFGFQASDSRRISTSHLTSQTPEAREKPKYQPRHQAHVQPPHLPMRNQPPYSRSNSECPLFNPPNGYGQSYLEDDGEGPVIVSLKKYRSSERNNADVQDSLCSQDTDLQSFRPRFRSECGVLSPRFKRK